MKGFLWVSLLFFFMPSIWSQTIGIYQEGSPLDVSGTVLDITAGEETEEEFYIVNESSATLLLRVRRLRLQTVVGATDYLCWGKDTETEICYPSIVVGPNEDWTSPDAYSWAPLDSGILSAFHLANGNSGVALYRYYIVDDAWQKLDSVDVRFTAEVASAGILLDPAHFTIYPNPSSHEVFIEWFQDKSNCALRIYDITGALVEERELTQGVNEFDLSDCGSGLYCCALFQEGRLIQKRKLMLR